MDALKNDRAFLLQVINKTSTYTGKRLLRSEIEGLIQYINELNFRMMNDTKDNIIDKIARNFSTQLKTTSMPYIDIHEVMKGYIGIDSKVGVSSTYGSPYTLPSSIGVPEIDSASNAKQNSDFRQQVANPTSNKPAPGYTKPQETQNLYLLLDSKYRNLSTDQSVFSWTVMNAANVTQGTVNTLCDKIQNIINMQFEQFNIPYVGSADNVYKKIAVYIEEFASMSILIASGRRYHIMLNSTISGNQIELMPQYNDRGRFRFSNPVHILNTITIRMYSPFAPITFLKDRYNVQLQSNGALTNVIFTEEHKVSDGELVYFTDYSTLSTQDNPIIEDINSETGHIVSFIDNYTLSIVKNITSVTVDINNITVCFIASRRVIIPVRMEYIP
jgi:hypothetical protein